MICKEITTHEQTIRQCARGVGFVALIFSLTVATLLAANWHRSSAKQTVRSEVLAQALAQGRAPAQNQQSIAFARELDLLARHAYFSSLTFRQSGIMLLVLGLLVTAGCFGVAWRLSLHIPDPRTQTNEDPTRSDRRAVQAVLATGTLLLLAAITLQLTHRNHNNAPADRALRLSLKNQTLKPGETRVCPCRQGTPRASLSEQWPFLRGPTLSGRATPGKAPLTWNGETGSNILWKSALSRTGSSSPVAWNTRLFMTTGHALVRTVMAYDTISGALAWSTNIPDGAKDAAPLPQVDEIAGYAAATPACDETRVYAIFGTGDLVALDHQGKILWQRFLGRPKNSYGHASSLVYCGEMLIVQWDHAEKASILAISKTTGETMWQTPREMGMSWSTPLIMPLCDNYQLLVHANRQTWGMELATGKKLWQVEGVSGEITPSLAWEGDVWLAANCYSKMIAFKLPLDGAPTQMWAWEDGNLPDVASPVIADGLVFLVTDAGEVLCHDLATGKQVWRKEFNDGYYASPIVADGKLYVVDRVKGLFRIYAADRTGQQLATNPMGEPVNATPAFIGGRLYIRSQSHLWCIEDHSIKAAPPK